MPSQIQNFTDQFFGEVFKTEVNGQVTWSLPCSLDVGLPNNPRGEDEGLACYFLRLFSDGIIGLTGPTGPAGAAGTNGRNAYSVTTQQFVQPSDASPLVQVVISANPAILEGMYVFINEAGWYSVNDVENGGVLFLTLVRRIAAAGVSIPAGSLVIPSGFPGASITGNTGPQGPQGPTGPSGSSTTTSNGYYYADVGSDYSIPIAYHFVDFTNSQPNFLAPVAGKYLVTATVAIKGGASVVDADVVEVKLRNTSVNADIPGSEKSLSNIAVNQVSQITLNAIVETGGAGETIAIFAQGSTAGHFSALYATTSLTWVRIA